MCKYLFYMSTNSNNWFTGTRISLIALVMNILFVLYIAVVQTNDLKNGVKANTEAIIQLNTSVDKLEDKKLDKETFNMFLTNLVDIKTGISNIDTKLQRHIELTTGR